MRIGRAPAAVALLTLLAFAVRAWGFRQGLLGDELFAYSEIHGQSLGGVLREVRESVEVSPPLFFLLASLSAKLGDPTVWIRLPSLLLGTALVPLTFVLGRMTAGRGAALCAAALVTISPFAIFYADEARPYATLTFFAARSSPAACCPALETLALVDRLCGQHRPRCLQPLHRCLRAARPDTLGLVVPPQTHSRDHDRHGRCIRTVPPVAIARGQQGATRRLRPVRAGP